MKLTEKEIDSIVDDASQMNNPIYIGDGILEQIKNFSYNYQYIITKESVFNYWMNSFKEFYKEYPYTIKWDYEKFLREILDYYD